MALKRTVLALCTAFASLRAEQRKFQPEDLFRVRQIGATAWSPDGRYAAIEFSRPGRSLDGSVPSNEIALLDVRARTLRTVSSNATQYLGFFNAVWSADGRRLAFLSIDGNAEARPWVWTEGTGAPVPLRDLDVRLGFGDAPLVWLGNDRIAVVAWDIGAVKSGDLWFRILRGRNAADRWQRAFEARLPSVSVLESGRSTAAAAGPSARLVTVDLRTNARTTLTRGGIHRVQVSPDHRHLAFFREAVQPVASYFELATDADRAYDAVNWGTERHVIDAQSGAEAEPSSMPEEKAQPAKKPDQSVAPPRQDARRLSGTPAGDAALYVANASDGSHVWLCGGAGRPISSAVEIWHANEWMREIETGPVESIAYQSADGERVTAWVLLPPGYVPGTKPPMIAVVYPGTMYSAARPSSFSLFQNNFEHPQLFAALGYAVLLPSMPPAKDPAESHALSRLTAGVLPALDAAIARGLADPDRIGVLGQSNGGFATLGLITQTARFRTAIASGSFSDLVSMYGTFYGQYRYGDAGPPQKGQVFRLLQMEKGDFGFGAPPWAEPDRYRANSAILNAGKVTTPLMLIHGEMDFVPVQQAEEFFTALYRQDKRAELVRYHGEWHTIAQRANVLDLWQRLAGWLAATMPR